MWTTNDYPYEKPIYNPFEVFSPSKKFIREVSNELKQEAFHILSTIREIKSLPYGLGEFLIPSYESKHKKLTFLIKQYDLYMQDQKLTVNNSQQALQRAKQYFIADLYEGSLKRYGQRATGRCPFHKDKSPSFVIYPNNTFHCFGCQANGDAVDFVMMSKKITFYEAIKMLGR